MGGSNRSSAKTPVATRTNTPGLPRKAAAMPRSIRTTASLMIGSFREEFPAAAAAVGESRRRIDAVRAANGPLDNGNSVCFGTVYQLM
jgi:hypothetical protein